MTSQLFTEYKSISDITKEYDHMYKVINYHNPLRIKKNTTKLPNLLNLTKTPEQIEDNIQRSVRRTKSIIRDYTLCNSFDLFVTFTFNPQKVNRYDFTLCSSKMQGWLFRVSQHAKQQDTDFKYLIVPEFHKDGAIHFHALIANYPKKLNPTKVIQDGKLVYNLPSFRFGFTNAKKLDPTAVKDGTIFGYLTKYITKDMSLVSGRKRYWSSRNLAKPITYHNHIQNLGIQDQINDNNLLYQNQYANIYHIPKFE